MTCQIRTLKAPESTHVDYDLNDPHLGRVLARVARSRCFATLFTRTSQQAHSGPDSVGEPSSLALVLSHAMHHSQSQPSSLRLGKVGNICHPDRAESLVEVTSVNAASSVAEHGAGYVAVVCNMDCSNMLALCETRRTLPMPNGRRIETGQYSMPVIS